MGFAFALAPGGLGGKPARPGDAGPTSEPAYLSRFRRKELQNSPARVWSRMIARDLASGIRSASSVRFSRGFERVSVGRRASSGISRGRWTRSTYDALMLWFAACQHWIKHV